MREVTFQDALEIIESLPEDQRESLLEIVKHRLIKERRDKPARSIKEARGEYKRGEFKRGTVEDLRRDPEK